jgi:hypothetical protein
MPKKQKYKKKKPGRNKGKKYEKSLSLYSLGMEKVLSIALKNNKI